MERYLHHRPVLAEKTLLHHSVCLGALETYPVFRPSCLRIRPGIVPFAGEQHDDRSGRDANLALPPQSVTGEASASGCDVKQLVFVQHAAPLRGEEIACRMVGRGI